MLSSYKISLVIYYKSQMCQHVNSLPTRPSRFGPGVSHTVGNFDLSQLELVVIENVDKVLFKNLTYDNFGSIELNDGVLKIYMEQQMNIADIISIVKADFKVTEDIGKFINFLK